MTKLNCWEYKKCGRNPGGEKSESLGLCPAAIDDRTHGANGGINGGRSCWAFKDTKCMDTHQKVFAIQLIKCFKCEFYLMVNHEEELHPSDTKALLRKLA